MVTTIRKLAFFTAILLITSLYLPLEFPQQPQAQQGQPLFPVNAKYVNGVAPGYWPTAGIRLSLNLTAGTSICGTPPTLVTYAGGALGMAASATNYVFLDATNSCIPTSNTSGFVAGSPAIATVTTSSNAITQINDVRLSPSPLSGAGSASRVDVTQYGASPSASASVNGAAFAAATAVAVANHETVFIPPGTFNYSGSSPLWLSAYANLECAPGGILNYMGTGYPVEIAAENLTSSTADWNPYWVLGCTFTGASSAADGMRINSYTVNVHIMENFFHDFGNASIFEIDWVDETWRGEFGFNTILNDDGVAHKLMNIGGSVSQGTGDDIVIVHNNNAGCISAGTPTVAPCGMGISMVSGANIIGPKNTLYGWSPNIDSNNTAGGLGNTIYGNNLGLSCSDTSGHALIQFGTSSGGSIDQFLQLYENTVSLCPQTISVSLLGPAYSASVLRYARIRENSAAGNNTAAMVNLNNLSGQLANSEYNNFGWAGPHYTIGSNISPWIGPIIGPQTGAYAGLNQASQALTDGNMRYTAQFVDVTPQNSNAGYGGGAAFGGDAGGGNGFAHWGGFGCYKSSSSSGYAGGGYCSFWLNHGGGASDLNEDWRITSNGTLQAQHQGATSAPYQPGIVAGPSIESTSGDATERGYFEALGSSYNYAMLSSNRQPTTGTNFNSGVTGSQINLVPSEVDFYATSSGTTGTFVPLAFLNTAGLKIQSGSLTLQYPIPVAPSLNAGSGGSCPAGTFYYLISTVDQNGGTSAGGARVSITVTANQKVTITWLPQQGEPSSNIWRLTSGTATSGYYTNAVGGTWVDSSCSGGTSGTVPTSTTAYFVTSGMIGTRFQILNAEATSTTPVTLGSFGVLANQIYCLDCEFSVQSSSTSNSPTIQVTCPALPVVQNFVFGYQTTATLTTQALGNCGTNMAPAAASQTSSAYWSFIRGQYSGPYAGALTVTVASSGNYNTFLWSGWCNLLPQVSP